jgi:hypothetical protein
LIIKDARETPRLKGLARKGNGGPVKIINLVGSSQNCANILTLQILGKVKEGCGRNHFLLEHFRFNNLFILG